MSSLVPAKASARTFCSFRIQDRLYGVDVSFVREVSTQVAVTPVPQAPSIIRGLTNLRSRIFLVVDLRSALGLPPVECTSASRMVVLQARVAEHIGLLVERDGEIINVPADQIEESPPQAEDRPDADRSAVVSGVCKLDNELMMIVDPMRLIEATEKAIR